MYRAVEEYTTKPRARGARVELCVQTPSGKHCTILTNTREPNKPVKATFPFEVREKILHLGGIDHDVTKGSVKSTLKYTIVGYKPGYITAKVILDIPMGRDIETEIPL